MAKSKIIPPIVYAQNWTLPPAATFGSLMRVKGIVLELRARLPILSRPWLDSRGMVLQLGMPEGCQREFDAAAAMIAQWLETIDSLPIIPREIEDILTVTTAERRRWLEDGRLPSAGTRTIRLRGRARQITFHVFDPRIVEDLLDRGMVDQWREDDAAAKAENRRRAAYQAKLTRALKTKAKARKTQKAPDETAPALAGWEEFDLNGLLR